MNPQLQTIPARFATDLIAHLRDTPGFDPDCVQRAGIAPAQLQHDGARVTIEQLSSLYRLLAVQYDDETPGLFSRPLRNGTLKFLCLSMLDAPSLGVALHRFAGFFRLVLDDLQFELGESETGACVRLVEKGDLGERRILALEFMLLLVQGVASWMIEKPISFQRIDLAYPPPPHADEYPRMYAGPARFSQPVTALHLDPACLPLPIRRNKTALSAFLRNAPMDWFHVSASKRPVTHRVGDHLRERLAQPLTIEDVARTLHTSPRTLARRLAVEGSRFQSLKDSLRRDAAITLLTKTDEPIALIGARIGFDDPSAFNRAFKQWTGSPPGAYRRQPRTERAKKDAPESASS